MVNHSILVLCATLFCIPAMPDEHWPNFRGPGSRGVSDATDLPVVWDNKKNIAWKVRIPGRAWSSPVIWGDKVIVTNAVTDAETEAPKKGIYSRGNRPKQDSLYRWEVRCYSLSDGELQWSRVALEAKPNMAVHLKNTLASETPAVDAQRIYAFFGSAGVFCYDHSGKLLWKKDLGVFETRKGWGTASSPTIHDHMIFIQCDHDSQSFIVALDQATGEEIWRKEHDGTTSWSTPFIWENTLRTELITTTSERARSFDVTTGKLLWELEGMSSIVCPTSFSAHGLLYISSGFVNDETRPIYAIKPGGVGNISLSGTHATNQFVVWSHQRIGPYNTSPILVGDYLYVLYDRGIFSCFDAHTGALIYRKRLTGVRGQFSASPWSYGGKIFCLNEDGETLVIQAGKTFEALHVNRMDDEMFMASPAMSKGTLVVRGMNHLYGVRKSED